MGVLEDTVAAALAYLSEARCDGVSVTPVDWSCGCTSESLVVDVPAPHELPLRVDVLHTVVIVESAAVRDSEAGPTSPEKRSGRVHRG